MGKLTVVAGEMDIVKVQRSPELGDCRIGERVNGIGFKTRDGLEYTHRHAFPLTAEGAARAARMAARVQAVLDETGIAGLDESQWAIRPIYGSD